MKIFENIWNGYKVKVAVLNGKVEEVKIEKPNGTQCIWSGEEYQNLPGDWVMEYPVDPEKGVLHLEEHIRKEGKIVETIIFEVVLKATSEVKQLFYTSDPMYGIGSVLCRAEIDGGYRRYSGIAVR